VTYKDYLEKYRGKKAHFELDSEGYYVLDFTGRSFSNADVIDLQEEFMILKDEVDRTNLLVPYARLIVKF
jgi:hypothetical protein